MTSRERIKIKEFGDDGRASVRAIEAGAPPQAAVRSEASARLAEQRPERPDPSAIKPKIREFGEPESALHAPERNATPTPSPGAMKIVEFEGRETPESREPESDAFRSARPPHVSSSRMKIREFEGEASRQRTSVRSGAKDMKIVEFE